MEEADMRIGLNVPYEEKDEAKELGAKWDADNKLWYVPDGIDHTLFSKWLCIDNLPNFKANSYWIAETMSECWKCESSMKYVGLLLDYNHERLENIVDEDAGFKPEDIQTKAYQEWENSIESVRWVRQKLKAMPFYLKLIDNTVLARIKLINTDYFMDYSKHMDCSYFMNHCHKCLMIQGDFHVFQEPDGPFCPTSNISVSKIKLHHFKEKCIGLSDGFSIDPLRYDNNIHIFHL